MGFLKYLTGHCEGYSDIIKFRRFRLSWAQITDYQLFYAESKLAYMGYTHTVNKR